MECKDAIGKITPFLTDELTLEETESLIRHTDSCSSCREELEIYFTVMSAMEKMDQDHFQSYDIKGQFDELIRRKKKEIFFWRTVRYLKYAALAACSILLLISIIMELQFLY